jgi:large subunit ribosomal protein L24
MAGLHVKKGDKVRVLTGKDRKTEGRVIEVYPERNRVLVEGVNRIKKHTRVSYNQRGAQSGGIVTQEAPIHASNVQLVCPNCGKPSRTGHRREVDETTGKTRSVRVCRRCEKDV